MAPKLLPTKPPASKPIDIPKPKRPSRQEVESDFFKLMDLMSESQNNDLKPVIIEIALTDHLPYHIRIKAMDVLPNFVTTASKFTHSPT